MRKFLVVVDQTPECLKALRFAARRASRTGGGVVMLFVIEPEEFQHWATVAETMRAEAWSEAEARLNALAEEVKALAGTSPETIIREGLKREQVLQLIDESPEIAILVLGAGSENEGPGPLVTSLAGSMAGRLPIPVTLVPGHMTLSQIDDLC
ncbi:MAG: universal stress protein [Rhodobacteraceae bacterium]|nr:universal stress protein [Paracoccaceae bacterium]